MTDAELVALVRAGDREAFRVLVERYQDAVFAVAASKIRLRADAEDIAQETFLAAFQSLGRLKDPAKFGGWLYGIARNKVRMHLRAARSDRERFETTSDASRRSSEETLARTELRETVMEALQRLSDPQRETAMLFYINGYSQADIAQFTALPLGSVKRRLHEARGQLKKELIGMVEHELKQSRPDSSFADRVISRVNKIRFCVSKYSCGGRVMLTDAKMRSMGLDGDPGWPGLKPWLTKRPPHNRRDLYAAIVQTLAEFGWKICDVVVETDMNGVSRSLIRLQGRSGAVETPAATLDALSFALRADAPIYVEETVVERKVIKDDAGNPLPPDRAWRHFAKSIREWEKEIGQAPFDTMAAVIRAFKKTPDDHRVRRAFTEAAEPFHWTPPRIEDRRNAWASFSRWVRRATGTPWEGLAAGMMGAVYLWPKGDARGALRYYEQAHRCLPDDVAIAFEFATACAFTRQAAKALSLLRRIKDEPRVMFPLRCGNFRPLWNDPRFKKLFGTPDPRFSEVFFVPQFDIIAEIGDNLKTFTKPVEPLAAFPAIREDHRPRIEKWATAGALVPVANAWLEPYPPPKPGEREQSLFFTLVLDDRKLTGFRVPRDEKTIFERAHCTSKGRAPHTAETVHVLLMAVGVKLEAVILTHCHRGTLEALLAVTSRDHQALAPISGASGIALARTAPCPVLIAEGVVKKRTRPAVSMPRYTVN